MKNKIIRLIQNYLIGASPLVLLCGMLGFFFPSLNDNPETYSLFMRILWQISAINLMLWFATLILYMAGLVLIPVLREKTLKRLANIKEQDEREAYITGQAARKTYLSTLSLGLFMLFVSLFSVQVSWDSEAREKGKPRGEVSIGVGFSVLSKSEDGRVAPASRKNIIDTEEIRLSTASILLILLVVHLVTFRRNARKISRMQEC